MDLKNENYYSVEANKEYISYSQLTDFLGTYAHEGCEARALAKVKGEFENEETDALLIGGYIDSYFEGSLDTFKELHPNIISSRGTTAGQLKAQYKHADVMIARAERDELFMKYMAGDKQVIMTGELEGVPVKIKIDSTDGKRITDLKTTRSIYDSYYIPGFKDRTNFIEFNGYHIQAALYREIYRQNTGDTLPYYINAISKETQPRIQVIKLPTQMLDDTLDYIKRNIVDVQDIKAGRKEPCRCGKCDYCAETEVLKKLIMLGDLTK